jgi:hypothetical protein
VNKLLRGRVKPAQKILLKLHVTFCWSNSAYFLLSYYYFVIPDSLCSFPARPAHDEVDVGVAAARDERLLAVQHKLAAFVLGSC